MKFSITAAVVAFATTVVATPVSPVGGHSQIRFPVDDNVTVQQASAKCGDKAQLSCCNKATYAGDTNTIQTGLLAGALSGLLSGGSGSQGLGLFDQCSKLPLTVLGIGLNDLINQQCKQNIACCQNTASSPTGNLIGVGLPCVALGSIL